MRFGDLKISRRLGIGLGLIIAFMVLLTITGIWSLGTINGKLEQIIGVNNTKINLAHIIQTSIANLDKAVLTIVVANEEGMTKTEKQKIAQAREAYKTALEKLEGMEKSPKGKELIEAIKGNVAIARTANDKVIELASAGNTQSASTLLTGSLQISGMLSESCDEMVKYQSERTAIGAKEARTTFVRARFVLIIIGAVVFAFAIFLASFLARGIAKPLSEGVAVAHRIADGDLTTEIEIKSQDETGQLLTAMKDMVGKLQKIIGEVKSVATNMAAASQQLNQSSEIMSTGAGEQAGRASQVATASEEMSQTVLDIAKNTSAIETSATDTARLAKDGEDVVDRSVEKVKAIARTIGQSAELIKSLGERSNQIGEIISVINDIADQTNLLALNAAIEAARAGDAGRGFAVVADEVKKLAERTGNSTSEIGGMIQSIQNEVHQAVISMENISTEVKSGVDLSSQAGDVLRNIVGSVNELHSMVQQIASATEQMAATSEEINRDIETIASVSKETSKSSEHIASASQELAGLSITLEQVVGGFRV
ncbi:MAG TPA: methyl-accepting chemotaxis protein [Syntrophorhabdaceae bacterium]|jgi:methyl-accepting chemotaxis protein